MVYILAQKANVDKIKEVISTNKNGECGCEISIPMLLELGHVETLVVDWNCYKMVRSLYRVVSIDDLAFVLGNHYIDSSQAGKKILSDYERMALEGKRLITRRLV